jgi:hypothetical protein
MKLVDRIKKLLALIKHRLGKFGKTNIDFTSNRYFIAVYFYVSAFLVWGYFCYQELYQLGYTVVTLEPLQVSIFAYARFLALLMITVFIMIVPVAHFKRATIYTLSHDPIQTPRILHDMKIAWTLHSLVKRGSIILLYGGIVMVFLFVNAFPDWPRQYMASIFGIGTALLLVFEFLAIPWNLEIAKAEVIFWGIEYLLATQREVRFGAYYIMREIVSNVHGLFLSCWDFADQINLWPQFNIVFLGYLCGSENEKEATADFLHKLVKMFLSGKGLDAGRDIVESLDEFEASMTSLSSLRDKMMLKGEPYRRQRLVQRVKKYEPLIAAVGIAIAVIEVVVTVML